MARDWISIGPVPPDEECQQVGENYDRTKAIAECNRYIRHLRRFLGKEPEGANLRVKTEQHDFGSYHEVVCYYDTDKPEAVAYAFKCESDGPLNWLDEEPSED